MRSIIISVLFLFFFLTGAFAENGPVNPENNTQNSSIEKFEDKITLKVFSYLNSLFLDIYQYDNDSNDIEYWSNDNIFLGFFVAYHGLSASYSMNIGGYDDKDNYGKTESKDFKLNYYSKSWGIEFDYQKDKGFYLENCKNFGLSDGDPDMKYPDLTVKTLGLNFFYVFNDRFSFEAAFNQTVRQTKWEWTFLAMLSANYFKITNDGSLIPESARDDYDEYADYQGASGKSLALSPGIAITVPFYNFYFIACLFVGPGIMLDEQDLTNKKKEEYHFFAKINFKTGLGYNGDNLLFGISIKFDDTSLENTGNLCTDISTLYAEVFAGIRI